MSDCLREMKNVPPEISATSVRAKPKVGIVISGDLSRGLPFGGELGFLQHLLPELRLNYKAFGFVLDTHAGGSKVQLPTNVELYPLFRARYPSSIPLRLQCLVGYWRNRKRILSSGVDILYVHSWEIALPFLFGAKRLPVVFHQHGAANPAVCSRFRWARLFVFRWIYDLILLVTHRRAEWTIAVDRLCMRQANRHGAAGKATLVLNAVDTKSFRPDAAMRRAKRKEFGFSDSELVALFVGRLEEVKRVDRAIGAVHHLRASRPRCRLLVVGEGSWRLRLEQCAHDLGVAAAVSFLGYVPHDELPALYNAADVLLLPSEREGTPMVILEALACGTPVVATPIGGIPAIVRNETNGFLLDEATPPRLAYFLARCASKTWDRSEVASSVHPYSATTVARQLESLFEEVTIKW